MKQIYYKATQRRMKISLDSSLLKRGIPPFEVTPSRKLFGTPPLKIRGGRGSYDSGGRLGGIFR
ncbi:MAG: hypothetical protein A2X59_07510 [Nitrospirae bacterium GWC2_42_7]|nr:MAG: hypothetical protein A2X59_07510 [Nitrospirae bacterium GWC2_42_7]